MPRFRFRAARADGAIVTGLLEAESASELSARLFGRQLHLLRAMPVAGPRLRSASTRELAVLFQSLASLTAAGVPVEQALAASEAVVRGALGDLVRTARGALREGQSLSQALAAEAGLVPGVVLGMLRAGEHASQLAPALAEVADHLEREAALAARVRQALAYPTLLLLAGSVTVALLVTTVIPRFAELLTDLEVPLPAATRLLLSLAGAVHRFGAFVLLAGTLGAVGAREWHRRPAGALAWHAALLRLPVVGPIRLALASARVTRALGAMLRAGMPLLPALAGCREAAGDRAVARRLEAARDAVRQGGALTPALAHAEAVCPSALQLLAVGEASGQLAPMCTRAGLLAAQEGERGLQTLVTLLEPALLLAFGGLVAFVAAALLQAVYAVRLA